MGLAQLKQGKLADAVDSLQTALQHNPKAPGASMFLGIAYFQMNRLDQARVALQQEIALNPDNAEPLMWLGITELAAGNPEKAVGPDKAAELAEGHQHSGLSRPRSSLSLRRTVTRACTLWIRIPGACIG